MKTKTLTFFPHELRELPEEIKQLAEKANGREILEGQFISGYGQVGDPEAFVKHLCLQVARKENLDRVRKKLESLLEAA